MGINYRDRDLVAALHNLASQKEQRVDAPAIEQTIAPTPAVVVTAESVREGEEETQPAGKLLVDWTEDDWAAYGQAPAQAAAQAAAEPITDPVKGIVVDGAEQRAIDAAKRIAEATPRGWTATPAPAVEVVTERGVELAAPEDDDRHTRLRRWWVRIMSMQNDLRDWGELTGRHLATGETERGLRKMLEITQRELDILDGKPVEEWGEVPA